MRAAALREIGGIDEGLAVPGECGIFTDYELSLRFWLAGWQVGHMPLRGGFGVAGQGSTHVNEVVGGKCWGMQARSACSLLAVSVLPVAGISEAARVQCPPPRAQAELAGIILKERFPEEHTAAIYEQVKKLNNGLQRSFTGPALWEKCCEVGDQKCTLCGKRESQIFGPEGLEL